mgnify:CR=1 FL=1
MHAVIQPFAQQLVDALGAVKASKCIPKCMFWCILGAVLMQFEGTFCTLHARFLPLVHVRQTVSGEVSSPAPSGLTEGQGQRQRKFLTDARETGML